MLQAYLHLINSFKYISREVHTFLSEISEEKNCIFLKNDSDLAHFNLLV